MYKPYDGWRASNYAETVAYRDLKAQSNARMLGGALAIVSGIGGIYGSDNAFVDATGLLAIPAGVTLIKSAITKKHEAAMHADVMREVGTAAESELMPYTMDLENQTLTLNGNVQEQYEQLRGVLRRLYFEDLQLPPPPDIDKPANTAAKGAIEGDLDLVLKTGGTEASD